jgi:hypothetical protein
LELAGKYLTAAVSDAGGRIFFGLPASRPVADRQWTFVGQVEGETPGVGIWIRIDEVTTPDGMVMPAPGPYTTLIRWEWVVTAVLTADKPTGRPSLGLPARPQGA